MSHLTEESGLGDCVACFSKIQNYHLLPDEESQKVVDSCWNYLHENIANSKLQNVQSQNGNELPLCKKCFDAASELMELSEVVLKSEKKILNLSFEFSLGVVARRTQVESVNNLPDGQNSTKELIVLDLSKISPSLYSKNQTNSTEIDDFAHPCEDNLARMDAALNDPQAILEIVQHDSEDAADDESADSEDDIITITGAEELQAQTRPVVILKRLKEANVSVKLNSNNNSSPQHPDVTNLKHQLRNESSKKKVGQSTSSKIIQGQTGPANVKKVKKSVTSGKVRGGVGTGKKQHTCQNCSKIFVRLSDLKEHIRLHTGERRFKCLFCPKSFTKFSNMQDHIRIHTGERPFKCSHCTKDFTQLSILRRHEIIHTGEKPFHCSHCMKTFGQLTMLHRHERTHTGEKPIKCSFCVKSFADMWNLQCHLKIHTGEKPYKCSFCMKSFGQLAHWRNHLRIHTGERPFKCFHCTKTFVHLNSLKCHLRVHTREKTAQK